MNKFLKNLKPCEKNEELQCSLGAVERSKPTDPTSKPCHRLQCTGVDRKYEGFTGMNRIEYAICYLFQGATHDDSQRGILDI